ncbi:MAG: hypothetical protein EFT35_09290 [Methanophagales archaeon ANME-1-THS]|nr:MAG: hypothetical protein EFT35_09290 [Methanophagales archaeon ANME-1-THS]
MFRRIEQLAKGIERRGGEGEIEPGEVARKVIKRGKGKVSSIPPAKFCKRERGEVCPGNCNLCVMHYVFGQYI